MRGGGELRGEGGGRDGDERDGGEYADAGHGREAFEREGEFGDFGGSHGKGEEN